MAAKRTEPHVEDEKYTPKLPRGEVAEGESATPRELETRAAGGARFTSAALLWLPTSVSTAPLARLTRRSTLPSAA